MAQALSLRRTWVGFYAKSSGDLAVIGYESYGGVMWRLDDPLNNVLTFKSSNWRLGAGLGGDFGLGLIVFLNVGLNLGYMEGQSLGAGWGLSLNLPITSLGRYARLMRDLKDIKQTYDIVNKVKEMGSLAGEIWEAADHTSADPIIHVVTEHGVGLSAGLMRSFGGTIDILSLQGKGGYIDDY